MSRPTVATLAADLRANISVINTYTAIVQQLAAEVDELKVSARTNERMPVRRPPIQPRRWSNNEERAQAVRAFFAANPHAKCATNDELMLYVVH